VPEEIPLLRQCLAELVGTFILVLFGAGSIHVAVLTGALQGLWQVAIVWGVGISLAIYVAGALSGAHINPAITVAMVVFRGFDRRKLLPYILAQLAGAMVAAALLYGLFSGVLANFEAAHHLTRGAPGSQLSAMVYADYFPNPAIAAARGWSASVVSLPQAMLAEGVGTAMLAMMVFAITDPRNASRPRGGLGALGIGLTVSVVIAVLAPLTQAGLNPARDLGPRLVAWLAGWGHVALPGPRDGALPVYVLSPLLGALAGAGVYQAVTRALHRGRAARQTVHRAPQTADAQTLAPMSDKGEFV